MVGDFVIWGSVGHLVGGVTVGVLILKAYRYVRSEAPLLGAIMALGIISRAVIGIALFWISYLDLRFLRSLHSGDGFWALVPDARGYYGAALTYVDDASSTHVTNASPMFVKTLAAWMHLVGWSPASGLFFNVSLYALLCVIVVRACRPARKWDAQIVCASCVGPVSIAPVLLVHDSQLLKDEAFVFLVAVTCLSVLALLRVPTGTARRPVDQWILVAGLASLGAGAFVISEIRLYFTALVFVCLLPAAILYVWRSTSAELRRSLAVALATLAVASMGPAWAWSAKFHRQRAAPKSAAATLHSTTATVPPLHSRQSGRPILDGMPDRRLQVSGLAPWEAMLGRLRDARADFAGSGGATNIVGAPETDSGFVRPTLIGLTTLFVPISIVKALGWVDFPGGRGLLWVTDVDTALLDLSMLTCVALVVVRRRSIGPNRPYVWYAASLALVTGVLLAYVVTNFGTLFRLRLMMAVPVWMLPLATVYSPWSSEGSTTNPSSPRA
jgi:hypothetical protein